MLTPVEGQILPPKYSKKKVKCRCSCGNPDIIEVRWVSCSKRIPTCGKCKLIKWKLSGVVKYGRLTLLTDINNIRIMTDVVEWLCDCGKHVHVVLQKVIKGNTKSCGCSHFHKRKYFKRQLTKPKSEWLKEIPELIDEGLSDKWSPRSNISMKFKCKCGKIFNKIFRTYKSGITTCRKCHYVELKKGDDINGFIYTGESRLISPKHTGQYAQFYCRRCKKDGMFVARSVFSGVDARCGTCNVITADEIKNRKFGKLTIIEPRDVYKYETSTIACMCDCGNETNAIVSNLIYGTTTSCGNCRKNVADWYEINKQVLYDLAFPFESFPEGGVGPLEPIKTVNIPFLAECPSCNGSYYPRLSDIRRGLSLTCGCTSNRVSSGQNGISTLIKSLGFDTNLEYHVYDMKYDIFVPSHNLLIEYNGLKWHSMTDSKRRDIKKYKNAIEHGFKFVAIFEDEWVYKKEKVESLLKNKLSVINPQVIRPSKCEIKIISSQEADLFYDQFHYIGKCRPKLNYGVFYDLKLIAAISFSCPTRQSKYQWELVRMTSNPKFKVHGIWSKLFRKFIVENQPTSIVSFSDNRLFSGGVYEKMGFKFDGDVSPDYYWVKQQRRFHKSALRKTDREKLIGLTETQLRESQGYKKIWDLGKKRWVLEF